MSNRQEENKKFVINELSGWHKLLLWVKIILIVSILGNIYYCLHDGLNGSDIYDFIFQIICLVLMAGSTFLHERKKGVYLFFGYGIFELLYQLLVSFLAYRNGIFQDTVGNRLFEYVALSAVILIPTFIYYKKRIQLLK